VSERSVGSRVATAGDAETVTRIITASFKFDPVWSWVFPESAHQVERMAMWWRFLIDAALRTPWVWLTAGNEAASIWIPPGATELTEEEEARAPELLAELIGDRTETVLRGLGRFGEAHPHHEPHYYLSLLGTDPRHRGGGFGMGLLAENLAHIDAEHTAAYLESSNPANNARYERAGFARYGEFSVFDGGPVVTTMWRNAR
jgi:ribosomal protein S18 acetylase RimI-like enzyme